MRKMEKELLKYLEDNHGSYLVSRLKHCFDQHFGSLDLENRSVLEIGAGHGFMSALCLARGASQVVALEPGSDGSIEGINKQFADLAKSVDMGDTIEYLPISLEEFIANDRRKQFDYILMCNVINHIDEDAVVRLHLPDADAERKQYIKTLSTIHDLLTDTGTLLISDVGRFNFWNSIGLRFPACRTIEWNKHQNPDVWKPLLVDAGFASLVVKWLPMYRFRHFTVLFSRKIAVQCLNSHFLIRAGKREDAIR